MGASHAVRACLGTCWEHLEQFLDCSEQPTIFESLGVSDEEAGVSRPSWRSLIEQEGLISVTSAVGGRSAELDWDRFSPEPRPGNPPTAQNTEWSGGRVDLHIINHGPHEIELMVNTTIGGPAVVV